MIQRCAKPLKLIVGGEAQVAPPNVVGPAMFAGCTVVNSRSWSGAALENTVPPPATLTAFEVKLMHAPTAPLPTHVPVPEPVQQAYGLPAAKHIWFCVYGPAGPAPFRLQVSPSLSLYCAMARSVVRSRVCGNCVMIV